VSNRDTLWAVLIGVLALALYVATLQPDFGGPEDTPKFQFLGYVLGTAHPPGYPLYVMLSHLFTLIPIGSVAYRANLFSAVMAAGVCALTYVIVRHIGGGRLAAAWASAGLATGMTFWRSAVFAEVYSLAAVLVTLTLVWLLAWGSTGRTAHLLAAAATFSAGLGNHLTIIGLAPAAALYVLLRNRRALTWRVLLAMVLILGLGAAQYGFVLLRTNQGAPFLESRATTLSELAEVLTAKRFASQRFAFGPSALLTIQLPGVVSAIRTDVGVICALLCGLGLVAAVYRRQLGVGLIGGAACGLIAMILNLSGDTAGFITPTLPLVWSVAGLGLDAIARPLGWFGTIALVAAMALPVANLATNYRVADQRANSVEARFYREFFPRLPDKAAFVGDEYVSESMFDYLLFTGEAGPTRGIVRLSFEANAVRKALSDGRRVFAFGGAATFFATAGLTFERTSIVVPSADPYAPAPTVYELTGQARCAEIWPQYWVDISPVLATGSWVASLPAFGSVRVEVEVLGKARHGDVRELLGGGEAVIEAATIEDGWQAFVVRLTRSHTRRPAFRMALDSLDLVGRARLAAGGAVRSLSLCGHVPPRLFSSPADTAAVTPELDGEARFGAGWSAVERTPSGRVRHGRAGAMVFVPLEGGADYRLEPEVTTEPQTTLEWQLNGAPIGVCAADRDRHCALALPANRVRDGLNALSASPPTVGGAAERPVVLTFHRATVRR
jgi:Protein O-mannosyl-transferase TMEM260-like